MCVLENLRLVINFESAIVVTAHGYVQSGALGAGKLQVRTVEPQCVSFSANEDTAIRDSRPQHRRAQAYPSPILACLRSAEHASVDPPGKVLEYLEEGFFGEVVDGREAGEEDVSHGCEIYHMFSCF